MGVWNVAARSWVRVTRRRGVATVLAVALFAVIGAVRVVLPNPEDVPPLLLIFPVLLCAADFAVAGGLVAGLLAVAIVGAWDRFGTIELGPAGYLSRAIGLLLIGGLIGKVLAQRNQLVQALAGHRDFSIDLHCTVGDDQEFKHVNAAWERTLGYAPGEIVGKRYLDFVHPGDIERTLAEATRLHEGLKTASFRHRFRHRDGSFRWLEWSAWTSVDEHITYGVARDVTAQLAAEEELESAVRLRTQELEESQLETLQRLALAAEYRDDDTYEHAERSEEPV